MGLYTIALDGNPNAVGKKYADKFYTVSIKHMDQIENFIKNNLQKKIDGVIAFGVDIPLIIAKTADLLGVNYTVPYESAKLSEDKFDSKVFMEANGIFIPEYKIVSNIEDINLFINNYGLPIVIKPVDNSAARGISYIDNTNDLEKYYNYALKFSKQKKVQVEKYLEGPQISTESFVINGKIHNIGFADRNYNDIEKFLPNIIENGGDLPSIYMTDKHKYRLTKCLETISKQLNIKNGIIKGDIVIHDDKLYIIEFALRLSGGNFSTIEIPQNTGVDFIKIAIKLHMNMEVDKKELQQTKNDFVSMRYKFAEDTTRGTICKIHLPLKRDNVISSKLYTQVGAVSTGAKTTNHLERLGFSIARGNTREEAIQNAQTYLDNIRFIIE